MVHILLVAAKILVLLLGTMVAGLALFGYRRNRKPIMLGLGVGFALVAVGSFVEGFLFEILEWDLMTVHLLESVFVLVGLVIIAVLLRPRRLS